MAHIEMTTSIAAPIDVVFDLSRSIDVHVGSMSRSRERAIGGVTSGLIGLGERVTWRAVHFGIPFTMTSEIVEMAAPSYFVDQQVSGPFKSFRHEHCFDPHERGTSMIDVIDFVAPAGPIGIVVDRLLLRRYMERLIRERNQFLKSRAESATQE